MNRQQKPKWHTPDIESLEINGPQKCNRPFMQSDICDQQGVPYSNISCTSGGKGTPNQTLS